MCRAHKIFEKFSWVVVTVGLVVGCASQQPKPGPTPTPTYDPSANSTPVPSPTPVPGDPSVTAPPLEPLPPEEARREAPAVALVLGGAGISSFATVGLLKRFYEEGIKVNLIVATGWPALFSVAYGFVPTLKDKPDVPSVHELDWFASKLQDKDFYSVGIFESEKDFAEHDKLTQMLSKSFKQRDLSEATIPIVISAANTELGEPEIFDRGEWRVPLLKTMSVPGIYRSYPANEENGWINSLSGIDVDEAIRRQATVVVAVQMYDDYFESVKKARKDSSDKLFRKLYLTRLKADLNKQMKQAQVTGKIVLNRPPNDFSQKRAAILAGYKEGVRLGRLIRSALSTKK